MNRVHWVVYYWYLLLQVLPRHLNSRLRELKIWEMKLVHADCGFLLNAYDGICGFKFVHDCGRACEIGPCFSKKSLSIVFTKGREDAHLLDMGSSEARSMRCGRSRGSKYQPYCLNFGWRKIVLKISRELPYEEIHVTFWRPFCLDRNSNNLTHILTPPQNSPTTAVYLHSMYIH